MMEEKNRTIFVSFVDRINIIFNEDHKEELYRWYLQSLFRFGFLEELFLYRNLFLIEKGKSFGKLLDCVKNAVLARDLVELPFLKGLNESVVVSMVEFEASRFSG